MGDRGSGKTTHSMRLEAEGETRRIVPPAEADHREFFVDWLKPLSIFKNGELEALRAGETIEVSEEDADFVDIQLSQYTR